MQPQNNTEYKNLLTEVIKKQIVILGPDITLAKARNVKGLVVADDGTVTEISGAPQEITQNLIDQFVQLSGLIVKKTMEPLLSYHTSEATPTLKEPEMPAIEKPIPPSPITPPISYSNNIPQSPPPMAAPPAPLVPPVMPAPPVPPTSTTGIGEMNPSETTQGTLPPVLPNDPNNIQKEIDTITKQI